MATINELMAVGMPGLQAQALATGPAATITAAGANQAAATPITSSAVILGTGAAAGVVLPPAGGQGEIYVYNNSGNAQNIYPATGQTINVLSPNTAISLATAKVMSLVPIGSGWIAQLGA